MENEALLQITSILNYELFGTTLGGLIYAFFAILIGFILKRVVKTVFAKLKKKSDASKNVLDDILIYSISSPLQWAMVLAGLFFAMQFLLPLETRTQYASLLSMSTRGLSIFLIMWFAVRLSDKGCDEWIRKAGETDTKLDDQAVPIIKRSLRVFIILIGGSLFLQNMGYSVTSLLAGLGLGGAAIALASKDTLSNLFGAIVIFLDKPFRVGDWIVVGDVEGTVEEVGLRTTKIRTFANSLITLPNSNLPVKSINNWSKMKKRRIKMTVGLTYDTTAKQMEEAVVAIRDLISKNEKIHQDFYLVNFDAMGGSSLEIFIYCFTLTTNWAEFLEVKQGFLLEIMREMEKQGLEFAFPTQTLHIARMPDEPRAMTSERPL